MWLPPPDQVYGQMFKVTLINPWDNPWTRMMQRFWLDYWRTVFAPFSSAAAMPAAPPAAPVPRATAEVRRLPKRR